MHSVPPLFARQPVFDAGLNVWGFELLYRHGLASTQAQFADLDAATLTVVAGAFLWQPQDMPANQKILVNFSPRTILDKAPYALPAERTVIQVDEAAVIGDPLLAALAALKADGYTLAVDGYQGRPQAAPLLALADLAIIDVLGRKREELAALLAGLGKTLPMAKRVEDQDAFAMAKQLGFSLFQGYFFRQPQMVPGKRLASNELARLKLLRLTRSDLPDLPALSEAIRSDVSLSYRLLAYLNSPLHNQHLNNLSVERAVMVLGWQRLRTWLRVIALTDSSPTGKAGEISFLCLTRAKFFELVAKGLHRDDQQAEQLFTLGLFSLLDVLMRTPMDEILAGLPLEEPVRLSLLGPDGPLSAWTAMAHCFEQGDWDGLNTLLGSLTISPELAAESYAQAMTFAAEVIKPGQ